MYWSVYVLWWYVVYTISLPAIRLIHGDHIKMMIIMIIMNVLSDSDTCKRSKRGILTCDSAGTVLKRAWKGPTSRSMRCYSQGHHSSPSPPHCGPWPQPNVDFKQIHSFCLFKTTKCGLRLGNRYSYMWRFLLLSICVLHVINFACFLCKEAINLHTPLVAQLQWPLISLGFWVLLCRPILTLFPLLRIFWLMHLRDK